MEVPTSAKVYIKRLTTVPEAFVDELFEFYSEDTIQTDFVIKLESISRWLSSTKQSLVRTLKASYHQGVDYIITKPSDINQRKKDPRNNNYKQYLLTPDCFKRLALMSKSKNAEMVRTYFIEIESLFLKYRKYTMIGMQKTIEELERNQKSAKVKATRLQRKGFVYIIRASESQSLYKIGRTKDLRKRLVTYQSGLANDIEVLFTFETEDPGAVETCVKNALSTERYRKYKEVYKADIDLIKTIISKCGATIQAKLLYKKNKSEQIGGYYIVFVNND